MAAALGQNKSNLALMWHLLYDPQWQVCGRCFCTVRAALSSAVRVTRFQHADLPGLLPLLRCSCRQRTLRHWFWMQWVLKTQWRMQCLHLRRPMWLQCSCM